MKQNQTSLPQRGIAGLRYAGAWAVFLAAGLTLGGCGKPAAPTAASAPVRATHRTGKVQEIRLFNGKDLAGWTVLTEGYLAGCGPTTVKDGCIVMGSTEAELTGLAWAGDFPTDNYEVELQARRLEGKDYFCGMTFPTGEQRSTLVVGGWDGTVVGLSNVDGKDACENETTARVDFKMGQWYTVRLRVADGTVQCWIDGERMFEVAREGKHFSVWIQQDTVRPFGVTSLFTIGSLRNIVLRKL